MAELYFKLSTEVDKRTGELLAVYVQVRQGKSVAVSEVAEGAAFADYDRKGRLLGIELLAPCEVKVLDRLASNESPVVQNRVKKFFRDNMPRKMVLAS